MSKYLNVIPSEKREDNIMRNFKLTIEYDGGRYQGLQRLGKDEDKNTIENKLVEVLETMTKEKVELNFGLRTEVGVHAYHQIANFKSNTKMKPYEIKHYMNRYLPQDIVIIEVGEVEERFHASLNAKSKVYEYHIIQGEHPSAFSRKYAYYAFGTLDVKAMKKASKDLLGKHDFKNFSTAKKSKSTEKEIKLIEIYADDREVQITMEANDFLHNMARMIIGTLIEIGKGNLRVDIIPDILAGKELASSPAEPQGLYLVEVKYN